jgi:hypothetical protein
MHVYWLLIAGRQEHAYFFAYDTKEKEHPDKRQSDVYLGAMPLHTNQIASCFDALSITYMSIYSAFSEIIKYICNFTTIKFKTLCTFV